MSNPVSVGLVGYGNSAKKFHLPFIQATPTLKLVAILQRAEAPAEGTAAPGSHCTVDHPNVRHHRTADEFFADADIELVVVATHIDTHALMAKLAILAGKHGKVFQQPMCDLWSDSLISGGGQAICAVDRRSR